MATADQKEHRGFQYGDENANTDLKMSLPSSIFLVLLKYLEKATSLSFKPPSLFPKIVRAFSIDDPNAKPLEDLLRSPLCISEIQITPCEALEEYVLSIGLPLQHSLHTCRYTDTPKCRGYFYHRGEKVLLLCRYFLHNVCNYILENNGEMESAFMLLDTQSVSQQHESSVNTDKLELAHCKLDKNEEIGAPIVVPHNKFLNALHAPEKDEEDALLNVVWDEGLYAAAAVGSFSSSDLWEVVTFFMLLQNADQRLVWLKRENAFALKIRQAIDSNSEIRLLEEEMHAVSLILRVHRKSGITWGYRRFISLKVVNLAKFLWEHAAQGMGDTDTGLQPISSLISIYSTMQNNLMFIRELCKLEPANYFTLSYCGWFQQLLCASGLLEVKKLEFLRSDHLNPIVESSLSAPQLFLRVEFLNFRTFYEELMGIVPHYFGSFHLLCHTMSTQLNNEASKLLDNKMWSDYLLNEPKFIDASAFHAAETSKQAFSSACERHKVAQNRLINCNKFLDLVTHRMDMLALPSTGAFKRNEYVYAIFLKLLSLLFTMFVEYLELSTKFLKIYNGTESLWQFRSMVYSTYLAACLRLLRRLCCLKASTNVKISTDLEKPYCSTLGLVDFATLEHIRDMLDVHVCTILLVELYVSQNIRKNLFSKVFNNSRNGCMHELRILQEVHLYLYETRGMLVDIALSPSSLSAASGASECEFTVAIPKRLQHMLNLLSEYVNSLLEELSRINETQAPSPKCADGSGLNVDASILTHCESFVFSKLILTELSTFLEQCI